MSRRRSRIAQFKAPFLVSVAAPAAFGLACGGAVGGSDPGASGSSGSSGSSNPNTAGVGGRNTTTPTGTPSPVNPTAVGCGAPPSPVGDDPCGQSIICQNGEWVVVFNSCNPPAPETYECPASVPAGGSACFGFVVGLTCEYEYCYDATTPMVRCSDSGLWEDLPVPTCNPPPVDPCPVQTPSVGSDCSALSQVCNYGTCGDSLDPFRSVACQGGVWAGNELPCLPGSVDAGASDGGN